jgi:hypothetical protein
VSLDLLANLSLGAVGDASQNVFPEADRNAWKLVATGRVDDLKVEQGAVAVELYLPSGGSLSAHRCGGELVGPHERAVRGVDSGTLLDSGHERYRWDRDVPEVESAEAERTQEGAIDVGARSEHAQHGEGL